MKKVLVAEDEQAIREFVVINLKRAGYEAYEASNGEEALETYEREGKDFDVAILDIMMPGKFDGLAVCKELRKQSGSIGIIMLTARTQEMDKVSGLMMGADDYVTKPFSLTLLYAKTMALIRRSRGDLLTHDRLSSAGITLELSTRRVFAGRREVSLTPKEFALLSCLMRNRNMVMSREQLLVKCWGYDYEGESRAVDTQIRRLRDKLGEYSACIKTVIKSGYKLEG